MPEFISNLGDVVEAFSAGATVRAVSEGTMYEGQLDTLLRVNEELKIGGVSLGTPQQIVHTEGSEKNPESCRMSVVTYEGKRIDLQLVAARLRPENDGDTEATNVQKGYWKSFLQLLTK